MNKNIKFAIVVSEFNKEVSENLINGSTNKLIELGLSEKNYKIFTVPGAFEIPGLVKQILSKNQDSYDVIVTLGCIIKGETAHFEYISSSVFNALSKLVIDEKTKIPIILGILTTYSYEQALERSDPNKKNKGAEIILAAFNSVENFKNI